MTVTFWLGSTLDLDKSASKSTDRETKNGLLVWPMEEGEREVIRDGNIHLVQNSNVSVVPTARPCQYQIPIGRQHDKF